VNDLYLVAIGSLPAEALKWIETATAEWFPLPIRRLPPLPVPESAYDAKRGQYQSVEIMKMLGQHMLGQHAPRDASRVLGVTDVDLAIPMLSFLFGQAQLDGPIAVVSLCRLHPEFYGLPPQESVLRDRTVKEALHELGHTFGLVHCSEPKCAMSLATHIALVDAKTQQYCARCGMQLVHRFASREEEL
jgi:archaemetzincin